MRALCGQGRGGDTPGHDEEEVDAEIEEVSSHLRHNGVRSRAIIALLHAGARKHMFLARFLPYDSCTSASQRGGTCDSMWRVLAAVLRDSLLRHSL